MAVPFPSLTFATPSSASSPQQTSFAPAFNIGSGSAGGLGLSWPMIAIAAFAAYFILKKAK